MKNLGWALLVGGLLLTVASYMYGYSVAYQAVLVVVAAIGLWLALKKDDGGMSSM